MRTTKQLIAGQIARITFAGVLMIGGAYLFAAWAHPAHELHAARILSLTWIAALLAAAIAKRVALHLPLRGAPGARFAESWMAPAVSVALLLPITLHMPVALLISDARGFDTWVIASIWITGAAHVVFALGCALRAYQLAADRPVWWSPRRIYVLTILTSCVPFIVLAAIPPLLVAITAAPLLPLLQAMARVVARERAEIAEAPRALPRAIAIASHPSA
jgi:hypothetical protein